MASGMSGMRWIAACAMGGVALTSVSSCVGLFELDDYQGVAPELCELLRTCYGDDFYEGCLERVTTHLEDADAELRAAYLQSFADERCLESCTSARRCLDDPPLCDGGHADCAQDEHCCGFLVGNTACDAGSCCASDGVACSADGDCCDGSCDGGICGGVACLVPGEDCDEDFECCTEICLRGRCSENACLPDGSECIESAECCNGFCDENVCREPECKPEGRPCALGNECCGGFCVPEPNSELGGVCSFGECLPPNSFCNQDTPCCTGRCDPKFNRCTDECAAVGESCLQGACCGGAECSDAGCLCRPDSFPCTDGKDCCSGVCSPNLVCQSDNMCNVAGDPCSEPKQCCSERCGENLCCASTQCHNPCVVGPPLHAMCTTNQKKSDCIQQICQTSPSCCCGGWDDNCVGQFSQCIGNACSMPVP